MIGKPLSRVDGPLKVAGRAIYAYEHRAAGPALYGFIVGATIAKGRVVDLSAAEAERYPGVVHVLTHRNVPVQAARTPRAAGRPFARPWPVLASDRVEFFGQPVALVVATTFEQARDAALSLKVQYLAEQGAFDLAANLARAYTPATAYGGAAAESAHGDIDRAMEVAQVTLDATFTTPYHFAQPLEPQACLAFWRDGNLFVQVSVQILATARASLAATLQMPLERIHIESPYVGGGFGSKLRLHEETMLAALASRAVDKPVKVAHARRQVFNLTGHRGAMVHRVRLSATSDGRFTGIGHDVTQQGHIREQNVEQVATVLRSLYAAPNRLTRHRVADLDVGMTEAVRGPGEVPGLLVVESAVDQLAHDLGIDPIELRVRNEPTIDPERNVPFAGRRLVECMRVGASRFGWSKRSSVPGRQRDGDAWVGIGMAAGIRTHFQGATTVMVRMESDGRVIVLSDMTDLGTGTYTILTQVAAEALGVPAERVQVRLASSSLPASAGSGGSFGAANSSVALHRACASLRQRVLGAETDLSSVTDLTSEVARRFPQGVQGEGSIAAQADDPNHKMFSLHTYGATFAEVGVDVYSGEVRVRRMLGVFSAGKIINPKTARSQLIGGMIWGIGSALHEAAHVDLRHGCFVNSDLAEYILPVHADVPAIDAVMLDGATLEANSLGIMGVGELGVCGSGAAVANAVFNATAIRVREFPITMDKLLAALPRI
jgi:xanthine dehydrogenase YagR molybdenum-binding subunit